MPTFYVTQSTPTGRGFDGTPGRTYYATHSLQHSSECECEPIPSWTGHRELADTFDTLDAAAAEASTRRRNGHYLRGWNVTTRCAEITPPQTTHGRG